MKPAMHKICARCENLERCKDLEKLRAVDGLPLAVPLGWVLKCPDGWKEQVLPFELNGQGKVSRPKATREYKSQQEREAQILSLLKSGAMSSADMADAMDLAVHSVNRLARELWQRGELQRETRGQTYWYNVASAPQSRRS